MRSLQLGIILIVEVNGILSSDKGSRYTADDCIENMHTWDRTLYLKTLNFSSYSSIYVHVRYLINVDQDQFDRKIIPCLIER